MILAVDQGTTGTTCLVVGDGLEVLGRATVPVVVSTPRPGWVEQDADDLVRSVEAAAAAALADAAVAARDVEAIGIANQRETTVLWERASGRPVAPAIVWQDRRTAARCRELPATEIRARTGLSPDPYFSATKLEWLLRDRDAAGLAFGTVDSWLLWRLSGGAVHATDVSNASRTMLLDLASLEWSDELLELFGVPRGLLPQVRPSAEPLAEAELAGIRAPVAALAGDQQASLYGHGCLEPGETKATYGTGAFVLAASGSDCSPAPHGLVRTAAALPAGAEPRYALEGSIFAAGAAVQWLRDGLGLLGDVRESEALARSVPSSDGVHFVPALAGLGSPHWAPDARGLLCGVTRGTRREHVVRAALESIAFQVADLLQAMQRDTGEALAELRVDGGASANDLLMQFQADLLGVPVVRPKVLETTALGAAYLAGLTVSLWSSREELAAQWQVDRRFEPQMDPGAAADLLGRWRAAVHRSLRWAEQD